MAPRNFLEPDEQLEIVRLRDALVAKLQQGRECETLAMEFVTYGGSPTELIIPSLGNRELKAAPCPRTLRTLLEWRGNPGVVDVQVGSPAIHIAAWHGTAEIINILIDAGADVDSGEQGSSTPPLNTALAAGNAHTAVALLKRGANVQWKHSDGATALHVASAWLTDSDGAKKRVPPEGDAPQALVAMLLHNGVDPTQREGIRGLTPFDAFRGSLPESPWLRTEDEKEMLAFKKCAEEVNRLMAAADDAIKKKEKGNRALKEKRYADAIIAYSEGRQFLVDAGIAGHHVAVLWSNEAICRKQSGDYDGCRWACEEGLKHFCIPSVKAKLQKHLADSKNPPPEPEPVPAVPAAVAPSPAAVALAAPAPAAPAPAGSEPAADSESADADAEHEQKPAALDAPEARAGKTAEPKYKKGFLSDAKSDLYGPSGSVQGQMPRYYKDARGIRIPINQPEGKGPKAIIVPMPELNSDSDEDMETKIENMKFDF